MLNEANFYELERIITNEYAVIEDELIRHVIKDFQQSVKDRHESWKIQKLRQLREFSRTWEETLNRLSREHAPKIIHAIKKEVRIAGRYDTQLLADNGTDVEVTELSSFKKHLNRIVKNVKKGINMTNTRALHGMQDLYIDAVNRSSIKIGAGVSTIQDETIKRARELASGGIKVKYISDSGKVTYYDLSASIRRNLITTVNQQTSGYMLSLAKETKFDLVKTTAHVGSRPSHAKWQGKVFSISGKTEEYESFYEATGYGTVTGLCGANCRHTFYIWSKEMGDVKRDYLPSAEENNRIYKNTQIQRQYERNLRALKREREACQLTGSSVGAKELTIKINKISDEYARFLKDNHLRRFIDREKI